jgi:hypothetical protein
MSAHAHVSTSNMPAQARANRSFVRRLLDAIMDSRRRAAEQFLAEYDRAHKYDLAAQQTWANEPGHTRRIVSVTEDRVDRVTA